MNLLLALLLLHLPARADGSGGEGLVMVGSTGQADRVTWRLWSWTGVEGLPDLSAESRLRAEEQLRLDLRTPQGWRVDALGAVRERALPGTDPTGDLYRLSLRRDFGSERLGKVSLGLGRQVRAGIQGLQPLDGVVIDAGEPGLSVTGWAGRLWHPESWEVGDSYVLGAELRGRPGDSRAIDAGLGAEARMVDGQAGLRVHGLAAVRDLAGRKATLLAEVDPPAIGDGDAALRASLSGRTPLSRNTALSAAARWEGLAPASQPAALTSPMEWLAGEGYGALDLGVQVQEGAWSFGASGAPTLRPSDDEALPGGIGRLWARWQPVEALALGLSSTGAAVGDSWVAGGVAEARLQRDRLGAELEGGAFRLHGISGPTADVWEGRLSADALLFEGDGSGLRDLTLAASAAVGSDRVLASWLRGGLVLRGSFGSLGRGGA